MWDNNTYVYTKGVLRAIAEHYSHIYVGLELRGGDIFINYPLALVEFKVDFDRALGAVGKGEWVGKIKDREFRDFRYFGRLQRVIIADIYGYEDWELERLRFYRIPNLKSIAYGRMAHILNDGNPT